jgi:hypothetical protein
MTFNDILMTISPEVMDNEESKISDIEISLSFQKLTEKEQNYIIVLELMAFLGTKSEMEEVVDKIHRRYDLPVERFRYIQKNIKQLFEDFQTDLKSIQGDWISVAKVATGGQLTTEEKESVKSNSDLMDFLHRKEDYETLSKIN